MSLIPVCHLVKGSDVWGASPSPRHLAIVCPLDVLVTKMSPCSTGALKGDIDTLCSAVCDLWVAILSPDVHVCVHLPSQFYLYSLYPGSQICLWGLYNLKSTRHALHRHLSACVWGCFSHWKTFSLKPGVTFIILSCILHLLLGDSKRMAPAKIPVGAITKKGNKWMHRWLMETRNLLRGKDFAQNDLLEDLLNGYSMQNSRH